MFLHLTSKPKYSLGKGENTLMTTYDYVRKQLLEAKSNISSVIENNHGASLKYLANILIPVGIDVPKNPIYMDSLKKLANERGVFAHGNKQKGMIHRPYTPNQAKTIVDDCLSLCEIINIRAKQLALY